MELSISVPLYLIHIDLPHLVILLGTWCFTAQ